MLRAATPLQPTATIPFNPLAGLYPWAFSPRTCSGSLHKPTDFGPGDPRLPTRPFAQEDVDPRVKPRRGKFSAKRSAHRLLQIAVELVEELVGRQPRVVGADQQREVAGHVAALDRLDADLFQHFGEFHQFGRLVERAAVLEPAGPGEDRGDRVGRGLLALLVLAVVAGCTPARRPSPRPSFRWGGSSPRDPSAAPPTPPP